MKKFFLALISTFLIFSCTATTTTGSGSNTSVNTTKKIVNTSWKLVDISGKKIMVTRIADREVGAVTLDITADKISGSAGVNRYFGSYVLSNGEISISGTGSTKMMGTPELMAIEDEYLRILQDVSKVEFRGNDTLILKTDTDTLTFIKVK